ncbi:MAG: glucose-6-phosphate isomerase family protein [Armatimonadota bacterium]|nr:glucose-6-phosphate isomerase family protein [Armatimonadota bacterium]MDR7451544.1 glucose-6-phosphate isomerase family protein [Armatimonadota bacterium]MDR7467511.1 glucose-6-phosphate isomerase family protein [Armatimonadota bacterium]MDR7494385.1 glucose-6-phosphate isomerase family protein [Armatimonadota bacterium]MDR7499202.1 glucose-6-phosphate isomerase family protein [Armatimonadota bacterium]
MAVEPLLVRLTTDPEAAMAPAARHPRRAHDLRGVFQDAAALEALIGAGDPVIYETFEPSLPEAPGHLMFGVTVVYPGRVGTEFFMTRGHYHRHRDTAEVYVGLRGRGCLVVQAEGADARTLPLEPGTVVYVAPGWAHRSVNTGEEPLIFLYTYPADAGHDYATLAASGFDLLVVHQAGEVVVVPNPRRSVGGSG